MLEKACAHAAKYRIGSKAKQSQAQADRSIEIGLVLLKIKHRNKQAAGSSDISGYNIR